MSQNIVMPYRFAGGAGVGWSELGRTKLGGSATSITVASLASKPYLMILTDGETNQTNADHSYRFNSNSSNDYAERYSFNGGNGTFTSVTFLRPLGTTANLPFFDYNFVLNHAGEEKQVLGHAVQSLSSGATDATTRNQWVGKFADSASAITTVEALTTQGGGGVYDYLADTEVLVLGYDPTDTTSTNFWEELSTVTLTSGGNIDSGIFTAKKYLWVQMSYSGASGGATDAVLRVGNGATVDSGANYSQRTAVNGASDVTSTSQTSWYNAHCWAGDSGVDLWHQTNIFIINVADRDKLAIGTCNRSNDGSANANWRVECTSKWDNSSNQINHIVCSGSGGDGKFAIDSTMTIWGAD